MGACWQGRIRELEEIRAELAEKELVLLGKEQELLERDQTVQVLREEASALYTTPLSPPSPLSIPALLEGCALSVEAINLQSGSHSTLSCCPHCCFQRAACR